MDIYLQNTRHGAREAGQIRMTNRRIKGLGTKPHNLFYNMARAVRDITFVYLLPRLLKRRLVSNEVALVRLLQRSRCTLQDYMICQGRTTLLRQRD